MLGTATTNETVQTINAISSLLIGLVLLSIKSAMVVFITSTEEKIESIPRTNKVKKNNADQSHDGFISANACGYEIKINSGPAKANSSMSFTRCCPFLSFSFSHD